MATRLYVGNMSYRTTEESLIDLFSQFGEIVSARIIMDRETNRPKGFAFVEMADEQSADAAIRALDGHEFEGRNLRVNEAMERPRTERRPSYNNNRY